MYGGFASKQVHTTLDLVHQSPKVGTWVPWGRGLKVVMTCRVTAGGPNGALTEGEKRNFFSISRELRGLQCPRRRHRRLD